MTEKAPERHLDKERNKILNVAVTKLDRIINEHDPEVDVPIKDGVWDHLDNVCASLEARVAAERDALAAEVETAEQRGYANAMEAERKLHERRIGELEATLDKMAAALVELVIVPEAWMISGFPDIPSEAKEQIIASVMKARAALEEGKD